jgi:FkbM family methyltransferase|tara:strand:+ start:120 stop:857 length:738 start_codon:yes stop_codon:yes gene_type:complete
MNEEIFTTLVASKVALQWSPERINYLLANKNLNKSGYSPDKNINYFDLGTHEKAVELNWVADHVLAQLPNPYKIFAFEANPNSYNLAIDNCNQIDNLKFHNIALVSKIPESGSVKLYVSGCGLGDSIYRERNNYIEVEAKKLSDVIRDEDVRLNESINIIRMNIEGCEYDVIEDLIEADLIKYFDGFYGMWDDVFKLDKEKYGKFQKILKEINVYPFPFNGRDMQRENRKALINKSLMNSILFRI